MHKKQISIRHFLKETGMLIVLSTSEVMLDDIDNRSKIFSRLQSTKSTSLEFDKKF